MLEKFLNYIKDFNNTKVVDLDPISSSPEVLTGNPHLWNGQYSLIVRYLGLAENLNPFTKYHDLCEIPNHAGIYTRLPFELEQKLGFDAISFDELNGISFSSSEKAWRICNYGERNSWIFDELRPDTKPKFTLKDYLALPKVIFNVVKMAIQTKRLGGSGAIDQVIFSNPITTYYSRKMQPRHVFVWKMSANRLNEITWLEKLHFVLNTLRSIKTPKTSGKNMHLFIILKMMLMNSALLKNKLIKYACKKFLNEVNHVENATKFYPANHPFIEAIGLISDKMKKEL
jgi:hypothetical protein